MTSKEYKDLSVSEFTKATEVYETDHAGVYNMCKEDYPDILAKLEKEPFTDQLDCGCGNAPMLTLLHEKYPESKSHPIFYPSVPRHGDENGICQVCRNFFFVN